MCSRGKKILKLLEFQGTNKSENIPNLKLVKKNLQLAEETVESPKGFAILKPVSFAEIPSTSSTANPLISKNEEGHAVLLFKGNDFVLVSDDSPKRYAILTPVSLNEIHSTSATVDNSLIDEMSNSCSDYLDSTNSYIPNARSSSESDSIDGEAEYGQAQITHVQNEKDNKDKEESTNCTNLLTSQDELVNGNEPTNESTRPKKKQKLFTVTEKISKRRIRNEHDWKKNKQAIARAKGESYVSYKGVQIPSKSPDDGQLCGDTCRLKCKSKFGLDDVQRIFAEFYKMDINAKNTLLFKSIAMRRVARKRKNAKVHKSQSYTYSVKVNGEEVAVCKTAFSKLYQIGRRKIEVIKQKMIKGESAPSADRRGCHSSRPNKIKQEVTEEIIAHINRFPAESSHYSRNCNPHKLYLSPTLNMSIMYRLYLEECVSEKRPQEYCVKKSSYANIFNTKFNLSFRKPRSDTCSVCESGKSNTEHKENAETAFDRQRYDRELARKDKTICYVTMDLEQTMPLPKLTVSKAFYLRQLWFYNFGIHAITSDGDRPFMQTWTEDIASRGSSEIASCLWNFVINCPTVANKSHLIIWSDSCAGQNKNINIVSLYQLMILKNCFKTIDHKFPEVGHTYLDSDRDFGRIEKVLRRHETIFTPQQYRDIISSASAKHCHVNDMENHFYQLDTLLNQLGLIHKKKNLLNETVPFRSIKWIRVEEFGYYMYKETYDEYTPFKKVCLLKNKFRTNPDFQLSRITEKYGKVSQEKLQNLRDQLQYVKEEHKGFYEELLSRHEVHETENQRNNRRNGKRFNNV